jgi:hypothetical protein
MQEYVVIEYLNNLGWVQAYHKRESLSYYQNLIKDREGKTYRIIHESWIELMNEMPEPDTHAQAFLK